MRIEVRDRSSSFEGLGSNRFSCDYRSVDKIKLVSSYFRNVKQYVE